MSTASKYRAIPTEIAGRRFASKAEAARYGELVLLVRAGAIADLECQPRYPLVVNGQRIGAYVADFRYRDVATGAVVVEDVKGYPTPVYKLKRALVRALYGVEIQEIRRYA